MNQLRRTLIALGLMKPLVGCTDTYKQGTTPAEPIYDVVVKGYDGFVHPLASLATTGEKLNVLIRVKKAMSYTAALVFVERLDWSKEQVNKLRQIYEGYATHHEPEELPYPIKVRFQLDSVDAPLAVHVDLVRSERRSAYLTYYPNRYPKLKNGQHSVIWRANGLWGIRNLDPGVYRVRIENLNPAPEIDFEMLFQFFHHGRKA